MNRAGDHTPVTVLVTRLALLLAIIVGVTPILVYGTYTLIRVQAQLESNLRLQAHALTDFITDQPDTWDVATDRLLGTLDRYMSREKGYRVVDEKGHVIVQAKPTIRGPFLTSSQTVYAFGVPVGRIEGQESVSRELMFGLVVLGASLVCAWMLWGPIRRLPLAALAAAELNLKARDRYQRALLDNFPFLVWLRDVDRRYLAVNAKFLDATGQSSDGNVIGKTEVESATSDLVKSLQNDDQTELANGLASQVEEWVEIGGQRHCFEIFKSPVSLDGQIIGTVGYAQDITARKQNEEKLRDTLRMLEETQALSRFGGWEYDVEAGSMMWSNELYRLYGVTKDFDVNDIENRINLYKPEYRELVRKSFLQAVEMGMPYEIETQHVARGGEVMWVRTIGTPVKINGKVVCVRGNAMDITDKKSMELKLQLANDMLENRVLERTKELAITNRDMNQILSSISSILFTIGTDGRVNKWNNSATHILLQQDTDILGRNFHDLPLPLDITPLEEGMEKCREEKQPVKLHNLHYTSNSGRDGFLAFNVNPILSEGGELEGFLFLGEDITDLKVLESQLAQAQRLESIGQLAAGIAHEINTPIQFIGDSVTFLNDAFMEVQQVLERCRQFESSGGMDQESCGTRSKTVSEALGDIDYAFLQVEIPKSFNRVLEGIDRVSTIVQAMKRFSHPGGQEKRAMDINGAVQSTLTVSHNEWKYVAELTTDLAPDLPSVVCFPGDLNQVLLNVIINAAHAIADVVRGTPDKGRITVTTRLDGEHVVIAISDTGTGMGPGVREKIFDPFFTTKEVGKGSGQGLAIAYDIVVNKHGGTITFETEPGRGSTFFIRLPIGS